MRDGEYLRRLFRLALPITLQQFLFAALNLVGTLMVGQLGETSVAAVGLSGQLAFLLNLLLFGVNSGASIFTAQYWGQKDVTNIRRVMGLSLLIGLTTFTAAYIAEVVRGGLQAIPRGQYEAAHALGLGYWKTHLLVILPQALKVTIPAQVNSFIDNFKDTSLVIIVSIFDFLYAVKQSVVSDLDWRHYFIEGYLFAMAVYWVFCYAMSRYSQWLERHLNRDFRA